MVWFFRKEILTDGEIDMVKVAEIKEATHKDVPSVMYEIRLHGKKQAIGRCDLRMGMNEELYYAGQIGYSIQSEYRGHHYAYKACLLLFDLAKNRYKMKELLITCNPDNLASYKTLISLNGVLKEIVDVPSHHYLYQYGDFKKCIFVFDLTDR